MPQQNQYRDLRGRTYDLTALEADERSLVDEFIRRAQAGAEWNAFDNYWLVAMRRFAERRELSPTAAQQTAAYRIGQDLGNRIGIKGGYVRAPDYRDQLEELIDREFSTRHAFCEATGLTDDMLSHVLAKRKQLAIDTLEMALQRVGYRLTIVPAASHESGQLAALGPRTM